MDVMDRIQSRPTISHETVVEANRHYHDSCAEEYERKAGDTHVGYAHYGRRVSGHLDVIARILPASDRGAAALDCGAGSGFFTALALKCGFRVTAVEVSAAMREKLSGRYGDDPRLTVIGGDIRRYLEQTSERFDLISFVSVLHHLHDYQGILRLAAGRLNPGGVIYTTCDPVIPRSPKMASVIRWLDRGLYALRRPSRLIKWISGRKRLATPADPIMELAEYHARTGLDIGGIEAALRGFGLEIVALERNPSAKSGLLRSIERACAAGTDLAMIWKLPGDSQT